MARRIEHEPARRAILPEPEVVQQEADDCHREKGEEDVAQQPIAGAAAAEQADEHGQHLSPIEQKDGADGSDLSGPATPGKIIGPSFSAAEVPGVIEALLQEVERTALCAGLVDELQRLLELADLVVDAVQVLAARAAGQHEVAALDLLGVMTGRGGDVLVAALHAEGDAHLVGGDAHIGIAGDGDEARLGIRPPGKEREGSQKEQKERGSAKRNQR